MRLHYLSGRETALGESGPVRRLWEEVIELREYT
jgi:hypothetical protein